MIAEEIVREYRAWFAIENGLWESKPLFGFATYPVWSGQAVEWIGHLCPVWAQTLRRLRFRREAEVPVGGDWPEPWAT